MNSPQDVRTRALRLLARREHSEQELIRKLVAKGVAPEQASDAVCRLKDENLVDDCRFAEAFVRVREMRGYGPVRIAAELRERGVHSSVISSCVNENDPKWHEQVARVAGRKYRGQAIENYRDWAKRANFLKSRGFTASQIKQAIGRYSA